MRHGLNVGGALTEDDRTLNVDGEQAISGNAVSGLGDGHRVQSR